MSRDLTKGNISKELFLFSLPFMIGNLLQQLYNIADTIIVGKFIGSNALAAVGSSYTLLIFLTSIILGLCTGSGVYFSIEFGKKNFSELKKGIFISFFLIFFLCFIINAVVFIFVDEIIYLLNIPAEIVQMCKEYLMIIFLGIFATFIYNYFSNLLRSIGNSVMPVVFLVISVLLNIFLDILFIVKFNMGVGGAAIATVISQYVCAVGIFFYTYIFQPNLRVSRSEMVWDRNTFRYILNLSLLTSLQQSIMNFGILMVQGLVNSFGTVIMAGFSTAVKIDSFAYMPVQDFGNAFSTFIAQNYGARDEKRIKEGIKVSIRWIFISCILIGALVFIFASPLMKIFVKSSDVKVISYGVEYLRIVSPFYFGIGMLFLFYGYFRAINAARISVILTIISLGTRVVLAYSLSNLEMFKQVGIWASIPIGWILADLTGGILYLKLKKLNR